MSLRRTALVFFCAWGLAGCGLEYPCDTPILLDGYDEKHCFVDPEIALSGTSTVDPTDHDPFLELGIWHEQLYEPLHDGDECPIAPQSQGGVWAMPALRTLGIGSPTKVACTLTTEDGEVVSDVKVKIKMYLSIEGFFEFQQFPLRIRDADKYADVEDLFGQRATLECTTSDSDDRQSTARVDVVFTRG